MVVLDIEASFSADIRGNEEDSQDRIDLVLLETERNRLLFVEVKLLSNPEIRASGNHTPAVVEQIMNYRRQIDHRHDEIVKAYCDYTNAVNHLFQLKLPNPVSVIQKVPLLIVDYDGDQRNGRLQNTKHQLAREGVICLHIGDTNSARQETLSQWIRKVDKFR